MKRSTDRILTTHVGSLARPHDMLEAMHARFVEGRYDQRRYDERLRGAVRDVVRRQAETGIDVLNDGEMGKTSFAGYVRQRLGGFEPGGGGEAGPTRRTGDVAAFPEYYEMYEGQREARGYAVPFPEPPLVCTGPVTYTGREAVQADIANVKAALQGVRYEEAFLPAASPRPPGKNRYYGSEEEFEQACADALREEYLAIVAAGLLVQVDDPSFATRWSQDTSVPMEERRKVAEQFVDLMNYALKGVPADRVRFHTCYSINMGPRVYDAPLRDFVDVMLRLDVGAFSYEVANPRHAHEWRVWQDVKLPDGKLLIPGFISHTTAMVEHPEWIADQIVHHAEVVGRENVIAGADCGFSSIACFQPEIHWKIVWAKFEALSEGARLATRRLWRR